MLRFTSQALSFCLKNSQKAPFLSQRLSSELYLKYFFTTSQLRAEFSQKLLSGKYYEILGYPQGTNSDNLTDSQIKRQYLSMVKKYHSDSVVDPQEKLQNQQITKCIIQAFDKISSERIKTQISKGIYDKIYKDEDQIAMKIYNKKFNQIKYQLFKQGNAEKRAEFMEQLQKIRGQSKYYQHVKAKQAETSANINQNLKRARSPQRGPNIKIQNDNNSLFKYLLPLIAVFGGVAYYTFTKKDQQTRITQQQKSKAKHTLGEEKIRQIQKKSTQLYEKKLSDLINSYVDEQPPSLKYPTKEDPQQIQQLIQFTIGPDINLYEISADLLAKKENLSQLKKIKTEQQLKAKFPHDYNPFPLSKVKVNTNISLSLEAERCLQNIYIKVKDVADEIQQTGKYTPPKILFRFYGYVMFEIRNKPLSLQNYRDTEYISLFDLLFDYYSPIPLKRHEYNQYLVGLSDEDLKMYGQVHMNHRKIPERYITKEDKIVVMKDQVADLQHKYSEIWSDFYRKYMKIWAKGYGQRISTQHQ